MPRLERSADALELGPEVSHRLPEGGGFVHERTQAFFRAPEMDGPEPFRLTARFERYRYFRRVGAEFGKLVLEG